MDFTDFLIKGFTYTFDAEVANLIGDLPPLDQWVPDVHGAEFPDKINLDPAMDYIGQTYVSQFFPNYTKGYRYIWNKTESKTMEWHNDLIEGPKVFFLHYMTDVTDGGEICFRVNGIETGCLQPKKHLLIMASQELHVEHKANYTPQARIVSNYGFDY